MTPEIFCICEAATGKNGQFCILHTFNDWIHSEEPAQISGVVVAQIRCFPEDDGRHTARLQMIDADGHEVWRTNDAEGHPRVIQWTSAWMLVFPFNLVLPFGQHELQLIIDGEKLASIPFGVQPNAKRIEFPT